MSERLDDFTRHIAGAISNPEKPTAALTGLSDLYSAHTMTRRIHTTSIGAYERSLESGDRRTSPK